MAISSGVGPLFAWISVGGGQFPITHGEVEQNATRRSSTFNVRVPMDYPGAMAAFASASSAQATVTVSVRGDSAELIDGELDDVKFHFVKQEITASGRDKSGQLHHSVANKSWINQTSSSIISELAGMAGLGANIQVTGSQQVGKQLQQDFVKISAGQSLASVIHKLAEFDGARWWVKNGVLNYVSINSSQGSYTLNYKAPNPANPMQADFVDLVVTLNMQAAKGGEFMISSWHPKKKQTFTGTAMAPGFDPLKYLRNIPTLSQGQAQQHAKAMAAELASNVTHISATVVGDPSIDAGMGLQLNGTEFFDGQYPIETVRHIFGMRGYMMTITAKGPMGGGGGDESG